MSQNAQKPAQRHDELVGCARSEMRIRCDHVSRDSRQPCGSDAVRFYLIPEAGIVAARCMKCILAVDERTVAGWGKAWSPIGRSEYLVRRVMGE
jgi:hypothetical protein